MKTKYTLLISTD